MKRILFLMAAMTVMFASCQKSMDGSTAVRSADSEIRLKLNVKSPTKAFTESNADVLRTNGFRVAAVKEDNNTLFYEDVTYNSADGTFSVPNKHYFFPTEGALSFYAVYPKTQEIVVSTTDGNATITYIQDSNTDLIAAKAVNIASTNGPVLMTFKHLLSQVSVKAQGTDPAYTYKLKSVQITDADGGTYAFAGDTWTPNSTTQEYYVFEVASGEAIDIDASSLKAVGSAMSFIPGDVEIKASWDVYSEGSLFSENNVTVDANLKQGKSVTLNLFLPVDPDNAGEIFFMHEVEEWTPSSGDVIVKNPYKPELVNEGVFTVKDTEGSTPAKTVKFTKGNLYWNGSEFRCEAHQYDYPTVWAVNHVGHFYWSKDARVAYAEDYTTANVTCGITPAITDTLFAVNGGVFEGFTVLSDTEWQYLIDHALVRDSDKPKVVIINDKKCVILKPDNFSESDADIDDNYNAEAWATAEAAGLVALPFAGYRYGTSFYYADSNGNFWSCTPYSDDADGAWYAYFRAGDADSYNYGRYFGRCVRLVSVQNSL